MTDQAKLQQLFQAALKSPPADYGVNPVKQRSVPSAVSTALPTAAVAAVDKLPVASPAVTAEEPAAASVEPGRGLNREESEALGALLDGQVRRRKRKHRMEALVTALVLFSMTTGGLGWFVSDASRVQAFQAAVREIRSVGDIKALVASYQESLDRIAARSNQIDHASMAMGSDPSKCTDEDPSMDAEMSEMMGEDGGPTVGSRNQRLRESFGDMARQSDLGDAKDSATSETANADKFDWNR
jgi:hypothetical protein